MLFRAHPRCQPALIALPRDQDVGLAAQAPLYLPPWISASSGDRVLTTLWPQTLLPQAPRGPQSPTFSCRHHGVASPTINPELSPAARFHPGLLTSMRSLPKACLLTAPMDCVSMTRQPPACECLCHDHGFVVCGEASPVLCSVCCFLGSRAPASDTRTLSRRRD